MIKANQSDDNPYSKYIMASTQYFISYTIGAIKSQNSMCIDTFPPEASLFASTKCGSSELGSHQILDILPYFMKIAAFACVKSNFTHL